MTFEDLLAPVAGEFDVEEALAEWRWLVPEPATALVVSAFGDLFLATKSGAVLFLDTIAGTRAEVAPSVEEWKQALRDPEKVDEWFMPSLLIVLHETGIYLSQGECYSPIHAPALGGSVSVDNWKPTHWRVHFAFAGRLHEQVKKLPPGTQVREISYDRL